MSRNALPVRAPVPPRLVLLVGVTASSTASTFVRLAQADLPSLAVAAWRLTLASFILLPIAVLTGRAELRSLTRREWGLALASGVLLALHFATWISSLAYTSVAASMVLVSTSPLFVGLISHLLLKQPLSRRLLLGIGVAFAGSIVIGVDDLGAGPQPFVGDLLALAGGVTVAGYFLIGQRLRRRLSLVGYVFPVYGTAAVALMLTALVSGAQLTGYPPGVWRWLALLALVPQIVGHSSLNWALHHLPATYVSLTVLAEPIASTLLAWWILREAPTPAGVVGGALILVGLAVAGRPAA